MKLSLSTLLASIAILSPQALALSDGLSLDLQYGVRDAEALYGVATADGDLRLFNQGPSATQVRWFDPLRGEEEERVLKPGQVLLSQGHLGVPVSEGTIVLLEKLGPGPISTGLASIPSSASMHDSVHCLHNNGAFLPWHRGYFTSVDSLVGGTMCSVESYRGALGALSSFSSKHSGGGHFILGDGTVRFLVGDEPRDLTPQELQQLGGQEGEAVHDSVHCYTEPTDGDDIFMPNAELAIWTQTLNLEHGPGLHDSIHCIVGGTMCSATLSNDPLSFSHHANIDYLALRHDGVALDSGQALDILISIEGSEGALGELLTPYGDLNPWNADGHVQGSLVGATVLSIWTAGSTTGIWTAGGTTGIWTAGGTTSIWTAGSTTSIWTSGTASIWSDGTFTSIAADGLFDQLASIFLDGHAEEKPTYSGG